MLFSSCLVTSCCTFRGHIHSHKIVCHATKQMLHAMYDKYIRKYAYVCLWYVYALS